ARRVARRGSARALVVRWLGEGSRLLSVCFFTAPAPPTIYTLSLHDALPISEAMLTSGPSSTGGSTRASAAIEALPCVQKPGRASDRKSTRLNSSHVSISYAVFCLKKKKKN